MRNLLFISLLFALIFQSCVRKGNTKSEGLTIIQKNLLAMQDSINFIWNDLIVSDNQKVADIKRLLDEISYCQTYDHNWLDSANELQSQIINHRFMQETMTDSAITAYDNKTEQLLTCVKGLVDATPEIKLHSLALKLIDDINKSDSDVIVYRVRYDRWAKQYNQLLIENKKALQKSGPPYNRMSPKLLFELPSNF